MAGSLAGVRGALGSGRPWLRGLRGQAKPFGGVSVECADQGKWAQGDSANTSQLDWEAGGAISSKHVPGGEAVTVSLK